MTLKFLNLYGRHYIQYLIDGIDEERCYPAVLTFLGAVQKEVNHAGYFTDRDIRKLQQIYYRTNDDNPPALPSYPLFEEDE